MSAETVEIKGFCLVDKCYSLADVFWSPSSCNNPCGICNLCNPCLYAIALFLLVCKCLETCGGCCGIKCCNPTVDGPDEVPEGSNVVVVPSGAPSDLEMGR